MTYYIITPLTMAEDTSTKDAEELLVAEQTLPDTVIGIDGRFTVSPDTVSPHIIFVGAGPVGLWTAIQMKLLQPFAVILMLEKHAVYRPCSLANGPYDLHVVQVPTPSRPSHRQGVLPRAHF